MVVIQVGDVILQMGFQLDMNFLFRRHLLHQIPMLL
jgi:hypothetical protein